MKNINNNLINLLMVSAFVLTLVLPSQTFAQTYTVNTGATFYQDRPQIVAPNTNYPIVNVPINNYHDTTNINATSTINTAKNPVPVIYSISPEFANKGSKDITINITGINFIPASVARLNVYDKPTSYVDSKHLVVILSESDLSKVGTSVISVFNPMPGGGASNEKYFTVKTDPNATNTTGLNLGANAFGSGFMPSSILEWLILIAIIILIILLIRRMLKKKKVTLTASNITTNSATLSATGLTPDETYVFQLAGPLGPTKIQIVGDMNGKANSSFSNLTPGAHYTGTLSKFDPHTKFLSSAGAPTLYFDTFKA